MTLCVVYLQFVYTVLSCLWHRQCVLIFNAIYNAFSLNVIYVTCRTNKNMMYNGILPIIFIVLLLHFSTCIMVLIANKNFHAIHIYVYFYVLSYLTRVLDHRMAPLTVSSRVSLVRYINIVMANWLAPVHLTKKIINPSVFPETYNSKHFYFHYLSAFIKWLNFYAFLP